MTRLTLTAALATAVALLSACAGDDGGAARGGGEQGGSDPGCDREAMTTDSGLQTQDLTCGQGDEAVSGATVSVHYVGTLEDGEKFDSSRDRGQPFQFTLGSGQVIPGWDEGIQGMKVGGVRKLTIPPELGYGEMGSPPVIPPNATLVFEVELLEVARPGG